LAQTGEGSGRKVHVGRLNALQKPSGDLGPVCPFLLAPALALAQLSEIARKASL
jgi:hypothetical protein